MDLQGLPAIVTGGASGLGAATARLLAACGARVGLFDLNAEAGERLAGEIGGVFARVDVTGEGSVAEGLSAVAERHGPARVLVNCAGVVAGERTVQAGRPHSADLFRKVIEINLVGAFNCLSQMAAALVDLEPLGEERGVIINTSSVAAFEGQVGQLAYAASKAGVAGMTLPAARDLASRAIRVVSIAPGLFHTPMVGALPQAVQDSLAAQPLFPRRLGDPFEFARLVRAIVENPMLNGDTIRIDAGVRLAAR